MLELLNKIYIILQLFNVDLFMLEQQSEAKMAENIINLRYKEKNIILIPTAHVSVESVKLVKDTIDEFNPDSICVELDEGRYNNIINSKAWKNTNIIDIIKQKKVTLLIANLILSAYQANIAKKLKTKPGAEMMQGINSANELNKNLVLADRDIQITFKRIWRKMKFLEKCKLIFSFVFSKDEEENISEEDLEELIKRENLENVIIDMGKEYPQIAKVLLHERDKYLAYKIKNAPGEKIIAILGAAHSLGVEKEIYNNYDIDELNKIPEKSRFSKILPWLIPVAIISLIIYGFTKNINTGFDQIKSWFLYNSVLAGLFTAIVLGHPLSILTAFIAAPFTSLNPFLACGWFAGLVEATIRKPTVEDVNNIPRDIFRVKGILTNRFLKALLIVIAANLGSSIGTIIAGTSIIKNIL